MEVDAVCDGETVLIPGIMEHVERAGVHSGDSMAIYPGLTLSEDEVNTIVEYTTRIGLALDMRGLMNIQYVLLGGSAYRSPGTSDGRLMNGAAEVYVLEVNPRAQPDDTLHLQGDGRTHGAAGHQGDAGPVAQAAGISGWPVEATEDRGGQGAGVLHVQAGGSGHIPGSRDEVHRRGDGDRLRVSPGVGKSADGRRADATADGQDSAEHRGPAQGPKRCP